MGYLIVRDELVVVVLNSIVAAHPWLAGLARALALYGVYAIPIVWVGWWYVAGQRQREKILSATASGLVAWWGLGPIWKQLYFHPRPTSTLPIKELLFERPENSFPSDHAAFLAGVALFFLLHQNGSRRAGWWLLALALAVSVARVAVAVHYPSDIFVGFVDGFLVALLVSRTHNKLAERLWRPLIGLARRFHLA